MIKGNLNEEMEIRRSFHVERMNLLRSRVELLEGEDRALLTMYLDNGTTFRQIAKVAGVNEATVARRIYKLIQRLLDGDYVACLRNRQMFTCQEMSVARRYFLKGESMRTIATREGVTYYQVRQTLKRIYRVIQGERQNTRKKEKGKTIIKN